MRILAAEHRLDLDDLALEIQRLDVMGHRHQVGFRRQLVGGMAPVAVAERPQLARADQLLDPLLDVLEIADARSSATAKSTAARSDVAFGEADSAETTSTQSSACRW